MYPHYLILNYCSYSLVTTVRPKFKSSQSFLLNMDNNAIHLDMFGTRALKR